MTSGILSYKTFSYATPCSFISCYNICEEPATSIFEGALSSRTETAHFFYVFMLIFLRLKDNFCVTDKD
jgi:hypothetical protein